MAKKKKEIIKLKDALKLMHCKDEDTVFIHIYQQDNTNEYIVKNIDDKLLKKSVLLIQPNHGGISKKYSCYLFVLDK